MDRQNNDLSMNDLNQVDTQIQDKLQVKNRYEQLSEKVILTAKEKEQAEAKVKTEVDARLKVEKERDFYRDFSQLSSRHPNAAQFQDKILEKVGAGYSTEDAMLAVLAKEGKLSPISADTPSYQNTNVAGGSAATALTDYGDKHPSDMSQAERRQALLDLEKQGVNLLKF